MSSPKDGRRRAPKWRPEFLHLDGVDGDPWRALMLQQLCYWTTRSNDPSGWVYKTAAELAEEIGATEHVTESTIGRKLRQLEQAGLIESAESQRAFDRTKRYRPVQFVDEVGRAVEDSRGPSSFVLKDSDLAPITHQRAIECAPVQDRVGTSAGSSAHECTIEDAPARDRVRADAHSNARQRALYKETESTAESTAESTTESTAAEQPPARDPDVLDDDEQVLVAFVEAGMHSAHIGQCKHLLATCEKHGVPDAVAWLTHAITDAAPRCRGGAAMLVRWLVSDIQDGKWREWHVKRSARLVGSRDSYAKRPAEEFERDERTDAEILAAASPERVAELTAFWSRSAETAAALDGMQTDEWISARVVDDLRWGGA